MDQVLFPVTVLCVLILLLVFLLKRLRQPYMVAYIVAGLLIGPYAVNLFPNAEDIEPVAEIGILLLMFFLGMEIEIPDNRTMLFKPLVAQGLRVLLTLGLVTAACLAAGWPWLTGAIVFILLIFNSTAVVSEYLRKNGELKSDFGMTVLNILLLQDLMLAPVLGMLHFAGKGSFSWLRAGVAVTVCAFVFLLLRSVRNRDFVQLKIQNVFKDDHDLQVFAGCLLCLGFGVLAEFAGLSSALGSFIAGIVIGKLDAFKWLEGALHPFKVFFVALFFVTIGLRLDLAFISGHLLTVVLGTLLLFVVNTLLSAMIFRG